MQRPYYLKTASLSLVVSENFLLFIHRNAYLKLQLGHSLSAQQMLFSIRKKLGANISINSLYQNPTLADFSSYIDRRLTQVNGVDGEVTAKSQEDNVYSRSFDDLVVKLPAKFQSAQPSSFQGSHELTVFLTGATGKLSFSLYLLTISSIL